MNLIEQIAAERAHVDRLDEKQRTRGGYTAVTDDIVRRAQDLHASGALSRFNIETILNTPPRSLADVLEVTNSRVGGRMTAECIPLLLDAHNAYRLGDNRAAQVALRGCVPATSLRMAARLAEIPYSTAHRWVPVS